MTAVSGGAIRDAVICDGEVREAAFNGVTQTYLSFQSRRQGRPAVTWSSVNSRDELTLVTCCSRTAVVVAATHKKASVNNSIPKLMEIPGEHFTGETIAFAPRGIAQTARERTLARQASLPPAPMAMG
jgi:hypothetical protein